MDISCIGYLGQKGTGDEDFHEHGDNQLNYEKDYGSWTFFSDAAKTVSNGCLGLQGEEESPR